MKIHSCQLCGSKKLNLIIDLGHHPLADTFLKTTDQPETRYPLQVFLCQTCGYAGLGYVVDEKARYQEHDYSYTSSNSPVAIKHFAEMAQQAIAKVDLAKKDLVVDIGSNAGTLLKAFQSAVGCKIVGVEPANNIAQIAKKDHVPTMIDFFNQKTVSQITKKYGRAKLITCTNVFNHISDLADLMKNVSALMTRDGIFIFETPYLLTLVKDTAFDTIYLEHVSYFSVKPFVAFFKKFGFQMADLQTNDYMGGSIRVYLWRGRENTAVVKKYLAAEKKARLFEQKTYAAFMQKVARLKFNLVRQLYAAKAQGKKIIGIGAATKGNTLLNYCGVDHSLLEFITDSSPLKIGKFTPGSHILIKSDKDITKNITHAVILPWNIAGFLKKKLKHLKLTFITPKI